MRSAKCDLGEDQQRVKREESRESREKREETGEERREKKEERREKREERREKREECSVAHSLTRSIALQKRVGPSETRRNRVVR